MSEHRKRDAEAYAPTTPGPLGGTTLAHDSANPPTPDGTLDLPASDQVAAGPDLSPGQKIGHFVIRAQIGSGGMGVVLAGRDPDLGRDVAIKLVRGDVDHPAYRERLLREARAMGRLEHPNVVRVYEVGSDRGRLFVVMELVDGVTLSMWLKVQHRSWREAVAMFAQIGAGLAAVHRVGLVHRDFKPDNVLIDRDGHARVADFGLARLDRDPTAPSPEVPVQLTGTGMMLGTPGYMAPEQQYGGNVDARADQYSYCIALRQALDGADDVPRSVRAVVTRGLSYDPADRFVSMDELLGALGGAGTRRRTMIGGAIAALAIAGAVTAVIVMRRDSSTAPTPPTQPVIAEIIADARGADAAVAVVTDIADADVVVVVPTDAAPDARTVVAAHHASPAPPAIAPPAVPAAVTPGRNTAPAMPIGIITPWMPSSMPAAAHPNDPGHRAVLLATIRDLGYDGYDPKATTNGVDPTDVIPMAVENIKVGMVERRSGHCDKAVPRWTAAKKALYPDLEPVWAARAAMGIALCTLAAGRPAEAHELVLAVWLDGNKPETSLVMALTTYERGQLDVAFALFLTASHLPDQRVQAAITTWLAGTGLTLP